MREPLVSSCRGWRQARHRLPSPGSVGRQTGLLLAPQHLSAPQVEQEGRKGALAPEGTPLDQVLPFSPGSLSPYPISGLGWGWGARKSEATTEAALEGKCGLCCRRRGHDAVLQCVTLLPVRAERLLCQLEVSRLPLPPPL